MKVERAASIPLIVQDPYISIWSGNDTLNGADTVHWCQSRQTLRGYLTVDTVPYCFLGDPGIYPTLSQKSVDVTATATEYIFEQEKVIFKLKFTSPLLLEDPVLTSRPCTYIDYEVIRKENADVIVDFFVEADVVRRTPGVLVGGSYQAKNFQYAVMGKAEQHPLGNSGDNITIDWGFAYLAGNDAFTQFSYEDKKEQLHARTELGKEETRAGILFAYDDLLSICYFGEWQKAYWTKEYRTILDAIKAALEDKNVTCQKAAVLDRDIEDKAEKIGGKAYAFLCSFSYRHAIAAHKLISDKEGNLIFLSKENDSNGCIGTVDVSYPSVPLFLLYNTDYVKGMLRPIFRFAGEEVWEYNFAPHDVGRYPYATGQVYGLNKEKEKREFSSACGDIFPFYYQYPSGSNIYDFKYQMPVEECGNMLIMTAVVCSLDNSANFALPYMSVLKKWTDYLLVHGADPGEQLCTDDFAGHLNHNVNLSAKAIMGIEGFARILEMSGEKEQSEKYHKKAAEMAQSWEKRADAGDHYRLTFDMEDSWSLKYNLVWDLFFGSGLFSKEVYKKEVTKYLKESNRYGVPLDSRREYTKSDWILWCASMAENREQAAALIDPVADYLKETKSRVPFSDWYETVSGEYCHFIARSVQGGIYMPILMKEFGKINKA